MASSGDDAVAAAGAGAGSALRGVATGLVYDKRMMEHESATPHPEQPARIARIFAELEERGIVARCERVAARRVTRAEAAGVHDADYVDAVQKEWPAMDPADLMSLQHRYNSIFLNAASPMCADLAAGSCCELVTRVVKGSLRNGMAVVRPPGHHAEAGEAMGFCVFNNVAVAARMATDTLGVERVLIVDWDVHHGNGTQNMFAEDPRVLYFSTHRWHNGGFYPPGNLGAPTSVGVGKGRGTSVNVGWNDTKMGDGDYLAAWHRVLMPLAYEFDPQLVLVSAGFDAARGDPLGGCAITPEGYAHLLYQLRALAGGKVVVCLEGGYNLSSISNSYAECAEVLLGSLPPPLEGGSVKPKPSAVQSIMATTVAHRPYWQSFGGPDAFIGRDVEAEERAAEAKAEAEAKANPEAQGDGAGAGGGFGGRGIDASDTAVSAAAAAAHVRDFSDTLDRLASELGLGATTTMAGDATLRRLPGDTVDGLRASDFPAGGGPGDADGYEEYSTSSESDGGDDTVGNGDVDDGERGSDSPDAGLGTVAPAPVAAAGSGGSNSGGGGSSSSGVGAARSVPKAQPKRERAPPAAFVQRPGVRTDCSHMSSAVAGKGDVPSVDRMRALLDAQCDVCRAGGGTNWVCLRCFDVCCGEDGLGHMHDHAETTGHCVSLGAAALEVSCDHCGSLDQMRVPELHAAFEAAHRARYGTGPPMPRS